MAAVNLPGGAALGGSPVSLPVRVVAGAVLGFLILPSLLIIPMSLTSQEVLAFPPRGLSLRLYAIFFGREDWLQTTGQSLIVASLATLLSLLLASTAAYGLSRSTSRWRKPLLLVMISPVFLPLVVIALGFYLYFSLLGLQGTTMALVLAHTAYVTPYLLIMLLAAMRGIDADLETAASTMGAGRITVFTRVTLPLLLPGLASAGLFGFLLSFDELLLALFLTGAETKTLPVKMYDSIVYEVSPVLAAVATLLTLLALLICLAVMAGQPRRSAA